MFSSACFWLFGCYLAALVHVTRLQRLDCACTCYVNRRPVFESESWLNIPLYFVELPRNDQDAACYPFLCCSALFKHYFHLKKNRRSLANAIFSVKAWSLLFFLSLCFKKKQFPTSVFFPLQISGLDYVFSRAFIFSYSFGFFIPKGLFKWCSLSFLSPLLYLCFSTSKPILIVSYSDCSCCGHALLCSTLICHSTALFFFFFSSVYLLIVYLSIS